jgi:hypothetical protein
VGDQVASEEDADDDNGDPHVRACEAARGTHRLMVISRLSGLKIRTDFFETFMHIASLNALTQINTNSENEPAAHTDSSSKRHTQVIGRLRLRTVGAMSPSGPKRTSQHAQATSACRRIAEIATMARCGVSIINAIRNLRTLR